MGAAMPDNVEEYPDLRPEGRSYPSNQCSAHAIHHINQYGTSNQALDLKLAIGYLNLMLEEAETP